MIPQFPNFKKISTEDRKDIEFYTNQYPPYSDFNFTSLWVWDTEEKRKISILDNNLVVLFTDYETLELCFSFLGANNPKNTINKLIEYAKDNNISTTLRYIPEELIKLLNINGFLIEEDRDNFDYIFSTLQLSDFTGTKYKTKRHGVNKFLTSHPDVDFRVENSINPILREHIINLSQKWTAKKGIVHEIANLGFESEKKALSRILNMESKNLLIFTCYLDDNLMGFEIDEILSPKYAIAHFSKVDTSCGDINDFLNMKLSEYLKNKGVEFCNWEQDLGIENLRKSKMSYSPITFLKKYRVSFIVNK